MLFTSFNAFNSSSVSLFVHVHVNIEKDTHSLESNNDTSATDLWLLFSTSVFFFKAWFNNSNNIKFRLRLKRGGGRGGGGGRFPQSPLLGKPFLYIFMIRWWWCNSWYKQLINFDSLKLCFASCLSLWSSHNGNTFTKWQLEILPMDNNCCLSVPLYSICKISFIPTVYSICKVKSIVYKVIVLLSTATESKGTCTSMLNSTLGHKRE